MYVLYVCACMISHLVYLLMIIWCNICTYVIWTTDDNILKKQWAYILILFDLTDVKDKAEIEKLKAELAALRKKMSEEESRRLRGEKEKAALEIEAVTKLRNETETLKVCIRSALVIVCMYVCSI